MTRPQHSEPAAFFSEVFGVSPAELDAYGAFNISLLNDLPLFIDPFLLFNSKKPAYQRLHEDIITYLRFLRDKATGRPLDPGLSRAWYEFPEVKQTWLGFSEGGNAGHGLGRDFAKSLHANLHHIFQSFGNETVTKGSHLEKLCLIRSGVGRDNISDFTTNLIRAFLAEYTQQFARKHIAPDLRKSVALTKTRFNYSTETWETASYDLPWYNRDYVLLTPKDILTKDDTWINKHDLIDQFHELPDAVSNEELRAKINNYFQSQLPRDPHKDPSRRDQNAAATATLLHFPELIDVYIRRKEDTGDRAQSISAQKVQQAHELFVQQLGALRRLLTATDFYRLEQPLQMQMLGLESVEAARQRCAFLKDVIENKGGYRVFYVKGKPIKREKDLHIMYLLTWFGSPLDVSREVDDGRGPVDFKISKGAQDKTLVEFKLASNTKLKRNLEKQVEIYKKASSAQHALKVILYFSEEERLHVLSVLRELKLTDSPDVILIDARKDNKPSGSVA